MGNVKVSSPKQQRAFDTQGAILLGAARVFSKESYAGARMKDIAAASGVSEGALYFHFGSKSQVALALLALQQERMTAVLTDCLTSPGDGLSKLLLVISGLGDLMAFDEIVQAGIRLDDDPAAEIAPVARDAYLEWIRIARTLIQLGIEDGSIAPDTDVDAAAEFANCVFVGAQVLAGKADQWASLPSRLVTATEGLRAVLRSTQPS